MSRTIKVATAHLSKFVAKLLASLGSYSPYFDRRRHPNRPHRTQSVFQHCVAGAMAVAIELCEEFARAPRRECRGLYFCRPTKKGSWYF